MMFLLLVNVCLLVSVSAQSDSCVSRCNDYVDNSYDCQCNSYCTQYGDCCVDYVATCTPTASCAGRCGPLDLSKACQCNTACLTYNDCCLDYDSLCNGGNEVTPPTGTTTPPTNPGGCVGVSVSNDEIKTISMDLWNADAVDRFSASDVTINDQSTTSDSSTTDRAPLPFFTYVNDVKLATPNYKALTDLFDNYNKVQGNTDSFSGPQLTEIEVFLDLFLASEVGQKLYDFLDLKGLAGCGGLEMFKTYLRIQWFELFSRKSNGIMDTSGFEHVFVGEIKGTSVSGFHNWVQFYLEEKAGRLDYLGYVRMDEPDIYGTHFFWEGLMKGLSGSSIGTGPFYEMAVFTLCHMARPGSLCYVNLKDQSGATVQHSIQTWTWSGAYPSYGLKYVASAYFKV